jgi:hypothetical protein
LIIFNLIKIKTGFLQTFDCDKIEDYQSNLCKKTSLNLDKIEDYQSNLSFYYSYMNSNKMKNLPQNSSKIHQHTKQKLKLCQERD